MTPFSTLQKFARISSRPSAGPLALGLLASVPQLAFVIVLAMALEVLLDRGLVFVEQSVPDEHRIQYLGWLGWGLKHLVEREAFRDVLAREFWLAVLLATGLVLAIAFSVVRFGLARSVHRQGIFVAGRLRHAIYRQLHELSGSYRTSARDGQLDLFDRQVDRVRAELVERWDAVARAWAVIPLALAIGLALNVWMAVATVLLAGMLWYLLMRIAERASYRRELLADRAGHEMNRLKESLARVRLVQAWRLIEPPGEPFNERLKKQLAAGLTAEMAPLTIEPLRLLVVLGGAVFLVALAGLNVLRRPPTMNVPDTALLFAVLGGAMAAGMRVFQRWHVSSATTAAARAIGEYLAREPETIDLVSAQDAGRLQTAMSFDHVTVVDETGAKLLDEASFKIPAHSRVAVLSTDPRTTQVLFQLFIRFRDPSSGRIMFDGLDLRQLTRESLRAQVATVLDEEGLFTGTVADNIGCGDYRFNAYDVREAAKLVHAYNFIHRLPQGFSTIVGQHGMHLDTSQRYRIELARAVLRDPTLLAIHEPDEQVDPLLGQLLDDTLARLSIKRTLVVCANRLATLRDAERILLFHQGRLHDAGTHTDLLQRCDLYRHLHYLRFNDFKNELRVSG